MNYFLFLNHPKGKEIYKLSKENEKIAREYFLNTPTLETVVEIEGKKYNAIVDYEMFDKLSNFDCFNCTNDCCADSPSKLKKHTKQFLIENIENFNDKTKNLDIVEELGYEKEDVISELENFPEEKREIIEEVENETEMCFYSYKNKDNVTLCSIHSICLEKNMCHKEMSFYKPLVCSLWPIEILSEDDNSKLYITLPDDFTNRFTIEDYYQIPCINIEFSESSIFRKRNPKGFCSEEYRPIIDNYKDTLISLLGERFYSDLKTKLDVLG